jgi:hypothetical protein
MHDTNDYFCGDDNEHIDEDIFGHLIQDEDSGLTNDLDDDDDDDDDDDECIYIDERTVDQVFYPGDSHTERRHSNGLEYSEHNDGDENTLQAPDADFKARLYQRIGINLHPCKICACSNYAGRPYSDEACKNCGHFRDMHS